MRRPVVITLIALVLVLVGVAALLFVRGGPEGTSAFSLESAFLWGLVFAFATLNILSLGARRFEGNKGGLSFGEVLAIMVVLVSILLLGWELLYQFQILPIRFTAE